MVFTTTHSEMLIHTIDKFWESVPPAWNAIKAFIRETTAQDFGITVEQFHILRHVSKGLGSVSELADAKQISRPATSQAVDVLVNKGLISRIQDAHDRRYVKLDLTEDGKALLAAIFDRNRHWMMEKFSVLSDEDLRNMIQAFQSLQQVFAG